MNKTIPVIGLLIAMSACKKPGSGTTQPAAIPTRVDSITGIYKGSMRTVGRWYYTNSAGGVDSGYVDSSYATSFTISKLSGDSFMAVLQYYVDSAVFTVHADNLNYYKGDPNHGGFYFNLYPANDSVYFYNGTGGSGGGNSSYFGHTFTGKK